MNSLPPVLALLILLFGGWGLGILLLPRGQTFCEMAAHAWLLGAFLVTVALGLLGIFLSGPALLAAVAVVMIIPGIAALRKIERPSRKALPRPRGFVEWALCVVILCECFILLRFAATTALGWDGLMVWEIKARIAAANGGRLPLDYFTDAARSWSHPAYPLMLPLLETWIYLSIGGSNQFLARVIFPFFYLAALLLLCSGATAATGKRWPGLLAGALLFFVPFLTVGSFNLFSGYADFPLAVFYLAAAVALIQYLRDPVPRRAALFAVYAAALPWMKQEGTLLWACLMAVAGATFLARRKVRLLVPVAAPGLIVIAGWKFAAALLRALPNADFMPFTVQNVVNNLNRLGIICRFAVRELSSLDHWSILWFLFPVALVAIAWRGRRALSMQLAALVLLPLAIYSGVYILSNRGSLAVHIDNSLPRLVAQLSLLALLALGIALPGS